MRWSETFIPTMKEAPREAEVASHQLMLRAGLIQNLSSGLYIYLPLGCRVLEKVKKIIRKNLNQYGAIELNMPALQPRSLWERSGRWDTMGSLMMRVTDREEREFVLGPTHEEIITDLVARRIQSYKELPVNFYQIQTKFRDEIRPRFGVIRAKEFIMKDGYSFDLTPADTLKSYEKMAKAYFQIFRQMGLGVISVEADTGTMGDGGKSQEFIALSPIGEDMIVLCEKCGYAANMEMAARRPGLPEESSLEAKEMEIVDTPGAKTIEEVTAFLKVAPIRLIKTLVVEADNEPILALVRGGDLEINEIKLKNYLKCNDLHLGSEALIETVTGAPLGFAGPIGLPKKNRIISDSSLLGLANAVCGANQVDKHYQYVKPGRDFPLDEVADIGFVVSGDSCHQCGAGLSLQRGIEVGHIFYLGKKYSEKLNARVKNAEGKEIPLEMGCYGIGVSRLLAAIIESHHDENGIVWPVSVSPFEVIITPVDFNDDLVQAEALRLYHALSEKNIEVLLDDRDSRPGFKFKDAELIGIPLRITVGKKTLKQGEVEWMNRRTREKGCFPLEGAVGDIQDQLTAIWGAI